MLTSVKFPLTPGTGGAVSGPVTLISHHNLWFSGWNTSRMVTFRLDLHETWVVHNSAKSFKEFCIPQDTADLKYHSVITYEDVVDLFKHCYAKFSGAALIANVPPSPPKKMQFWSSWIFKKSGEGCSRSGDRHTTHSQSAPSVAVVALKSLKAMSVSRDGTVLI